MGGIKVTRQSHSHTYTNLDSVSTQKTITLKANKKINIIFTNLSLITSRKNISMFEIICQGRRGKNEHFIQAYVNSSTVAPHKWQECVNIANFYFIL